MPIETPQGNLDIKNATLRTSNLETQNIKIGSIFVGTGNSLEETANVGNSMSNTIQFTNTHTAFTTTGNVEVGGELTVSGNVADLNVVSNVNLLHTSNTAALKLNSNVVTEFPRSKKLIKYPRVALTATTSGGYIVTASSVYNTSSRASWMAFDSSASSLSTATAWASITSTFNQSGIANSNDTFQGVNGPYIQLQMPNPILLDHFIIKTPADTGGGCPPKKINLYASNDNTTFTTLVLNEVLHGIPGTDSTTHVTTQTRYKYFTLQVTEMNPGTSVTSDTQYTWTRISDLAFYGTPEYDPEADGVDVVVKSVPNVPNTDWLEVYYDAKDLVDGSTTVNDLKPVGTAVNGTVAGNTSVTDGAFTFDGSGDYILSGNTSLSGTPTITYSVWFKTNNIDYSGSNSIVMIGYSGNTNSLGFRINSTGHYRFYVYGGSGGESQTTDIIPTLGNWVHATVTYNNGTGQELYLNGKHIRSAYSATSALNLAANSKVILGNYLDSNGALAGTASYDGSIANFRLFDRALTTDEIYQLYAYQKEYFGHGDLSMTLKAGNLRINGFVGTSQTGGLIIPSGTSGQLPTGVIGMIRFNTDVGKLQVCNGSTWLTISGVNAVGGTVTNVGGYTIHTFLSGGTFTVQSGGEVEYLVVAGGGGGGNAHGTNGVGGGGAGGMLTGTLTNLTPNSYTITVGAGGAGSSSNQTNGTNGSDSSISTLIVTTGGGGGGAAANSNGLDGGSGGGAGTYTTSTVAQTGGSGISGQGNDGRSTTGVVGHGGGGGGGAGSAAPAIPTNGVGGAGGSGLVSSISGTSTFYAGGGGGTGWEVTAAGSGGSGGGGAGGTRGSDGIYGTANTGGGGGGCKSGNRSGDGGSGIVIIRYLA